jgi:hypothetical protein
LPCGQISVFPLRGNKGGLPTDPKGSGTGQRPRSPGEPAVGKEPQIIYIVVGLHRALLGRSPKVLEPLMPLRDIIGPRPMMALAPTGITNP